MKRMRTRMGLAEVQGTRGSGGGLEVIWCFSKILLVRSVQAAAVHKSPRGIFLISSFLGAHGISFFRIGGGCFCYLFIISP